VQPYFDVTPESSDEELAADAAHHPVFELRALAALAERPEGRSSSGASDGCGLGNGAYPAAFYFRACGSRPTDAGLIHFYSPGLTASRSLGGMGYPERQLWLVIDRLDRFRSGTVPAEPQPGRYGSTHLARPLDPVGRFSF
jgi:hypothetical protein